MTGGRICLRTIFPFDLFGDPMEYFCFFHSYERRLKSLTNEELGELVRSLLKYSAHGERTDLPEKLSLAFDFISEDIDAGHAKAKAVSEKRKASAEARWMQTDANDANASKCIQTNTKTKTKTKTNTKDKYGGQNFDQKVVNFSELTNFIE